MSLLKTLSSLFDRSKVQPEQSAQPKVRIDLVESAPQSRERVIDVKEMSDEKVKETLAFLESIYEGTMPQYQIMRSGDVVRLTFGAELGFYDFASIVNNFVWAEESGRRYEARGLYPLGTATENGTPAPYSNSDLQIYVPAEEQEPDCVYYKTQDGAEHRYQF